MKTILVVEDDENDLLVIQMACQRAGIKHQLEITRCGEDALDYLQGKGGWSDRRRYPVPDLVFLDIKLHGLDGHDVLEWIRNQAHFQNLPVVMVTGSDRPQDIQRAYALGATSYFAKQFDFRLFGEKLKTALSYWLELNVPPVRLAVC